MDEVIIDFSFKGAHIHPGEFYTAMSRVKTGNSFYLRDFKTEYIMANKEVEYKMRNMEMFAPYSFKKVYLDQFIFDGPDEIKIGYININSCTATQVMSLSMVTEICYAWIFSVLLTLD